MKKSKIENIPFERILQISKKILAQTQIDKLLELILDEAIQLCKAERGFIILTTEESFEIRSARNLDQESLKTANEKISTTILKEVSQSKKPFITVDASEEEKLKKSESVNRMKLRSVLVVPLMEGEKVLGMVYLDNRFASGVFQESHLEIASTFADQASLALSHAKLIHEAKLRQKDLEEKQNLILRLNEMLEEKLQNKEIELKQTKQILESEQNFGRQDKYHEIVGESKAIREVIQILDRIIDSDVTVYVHGESGTGKELIARALHYNGPRKTKSFVSINCASFSDTLLESELFGHVRGAFTGAEKDKTGLFEFANEGTLFLDEVGDMSLPMQSKLLRVLQESEVRPVGANKALKINVRIVCASNKDLAEEVKNGKFRKDLYFRLNVVKLKLPPLRERLGDIPALVDVFMKKNKMGIPENFLSIEQEALKVLMAYTWPGNIRELENEMNRCLVMGKGAISRDLISEHIRQGYEFGEALKDKRDLKMQLSHQEKKLIESALLEADGFKAKAAELLGISRLTLYQKMRLLEIEDPRKKITVSDVEKVLRECKGNKSLAAKKLGIQRQTLYHKLERLPKT